MSLSSGCPLCRRRSADRFCSEHGALLWDQAPIGGHRLLRFHSIRKDGDETSQTWTVQKSSADAPATMLLFSEEARASVALQRATQRAKHLREKSIHPAFPTVLEAGTTNGLPYIIYEQTEGTLLSTRLSQGAFSSGDAARLVVHLLNALDSLHRFEVTQEETEEAQPYRAADSTERNLWHGGLSPSTLMLAPNGALRFTTMGHIINQRPKEHPENKEELWVLGMVSQPKQSLDIYLAGCLLYELLTQKKHDGFDGAMHLTEEERSYPTRIEVMPPYDLTAQPAFVDYRGVPSELAKIIKRATQISAELRYQSAAEMMGELLVFLGADASFSRMYLDEAVQFIQEHAAQDNLLPIAQLLAARPDLCEPSWFTQKLWDLLRDRLTERFSRRSSLDSIEWSLWANIPDAKFMLISLLKQPYTFENTGLINALAAQLLGHHREVSEVLIDAINSPSERVREAAARSLAKVSAAPPITFGGAYARIVPCSQRWDSMTSIDRDDTSRMCNKCQTPVIKVTEIEDLKRLKGRGCAMYEPNIREGAAKRAIKDLYTIQVTPKAQPMPLLRSPDESPPPPPIENDTSMLMGISIRPGLIDVSDDEAPAPKESLLRRIVRFFIRS
jgi:serine/threonine protein kinase